jgi:hypothetical protein
MAKPEKIIESLNKLYGRRAELDKKILEAEKFLLSALPVTPPLTRTPGAKKSASPARIHRPRRNR